jgi:hypothetical protein
MVSAVKAARGGNRRSDQWEGDCPLVTRTNTATEAGLSEHQRKTALRIANVPEDEFETAIESDDPPIVTDLAEQGRQRRAVPHSKDRRWPAP